MATDGCFKTTDTLSAWTEHKRFQVSTQNMERNKVGQSHVSCGHCVWLLMKLHDFIQVYFCQDDILDLFLTPGLRFCAVTITHRMSPVFLQDTCVSHFIFTFSQIQKLAAAHGKSDCQNSPKGPSSALVKYIVIY